jgi:hypothetical protein
MKRLFLLTLVVTLCAFVNAQSIDKFIGSWKFDAPTAFGYETGSLQIVKDKVIMTFNESDFKYPSESMQYESDTLKYSVEVDGEYVKCHLVVTDASNLDGYCAWSGGETKLIVKKE